MIQVKYQEGHISNYEFLNSTTRHEIEERQPVTMQHHAARVSQRFYFVS